MKWHPGPLSGMPQEIQLNFFNRSRLDTGGDGSTARGTGRGQGTNTQMVCPIMGGGVSGTA